MGTRLQEYEKYQKFLSENFHFFFFFFFWGGGGGGGFSVYLNSHVFVMSCQWQGLAAKRSACTELTLPSQ